MLIVLRGMRSLIGLILCTLLNGFSYRMVQAEQEEEDSQLTYVDFLNALIMPEIAVRDGEGAPGKFEGDIDLGGKPISYYQALHAVGTGTEDHSITKRSAQRDYIYRWYGAKVPYYVSGKFSAYERSRIAYGIGEIERITCIRFIPRNGEKDYIKFEKDPEGCFSSVGRQGGRQLISLGPSCLSSGIILHEIMHSLGFFHEQTRTDRDKHITVLYDNIIPSKVGFFGKYQWNEIDTLRTEYDHASIMHYGPYAFSVNGLPTIESSKPIGQRVWLSPTDVIEINRLYRCPSPRTRKPPERWEEGSSCIDQFSTCRYYCHEPEMRRMCCGSCSRRTDRQPTLLRTADRILEKPQLKVWQSQSGNGQTIEEKNNRKNQSQNDNRNRVRNGLEQGQSNPGNQGQHDRVIKTGQHNQRSQEQNYREDQDRYNQRLRNAWSQRRTNSTTQGPDSQGKQGPEELLNLRSGLSLWGWVG